MSEHSSRVGEADNDETPDHHHHAYQTLRGGAAWHRCPEGGD